MASTNGWKNLWHIPKSLLSITGLRLVDKRALHKSSVLPEEVQKFNDMAKSWWDRSKYSPAAPLHNFNAVRVPLARDGLLNSKQVPMTARRGRYPLEGYSFLDAGCGAGIYSEALARIGAKVTGIDPALNMIEAAREHASLDRSLEGRIQYVQTTIDEHAQANEGKYDAVVCSEVVEHTDNVNFFVQNCVRAVKPGGSLFFTTPNKTTISWFYNIVLGEWVGGVPKGTHHYEMLVPSSTLEKILISNGCRICLVNGLMCLPTLEWKWIPSTAIAYALHAIKE